MSKVPDGVDHGQLTIVSRRVLLDALGILEPHLAGVTVVGAQAVYLRSVESDYAVAGFTRDADLAISPELVDHDPKIDERMAQAGFSVADKSQPGTWTRDETVGGIVVPIPIDLLVPSHSKKRTAKLDPHAHGTARNVPGLEAVMHDRQPLLVTSLEASDKRAVSVNVAGVASLLIAKAYKLHDRLEQQGKPDRLSIKDAGDVVRLFGEYDPDDVRALFDRLQNVVEITNVVEQGRTWLIQQFGEAAAPGVLMAIEALAGAGDPPGPLAVGWISQFKES